LYIIHQGSHWTTSGPSFYGDHLLFERLYKSAQEDADALAERIIGLAGVESMKLDKQMSDISVRISTLSSVVLQPEKVEDGCIRLITKAIDTAEANGNMTNGLEDLLMSISSNRETALYLLKQRKA
jgi:DNA-binding ferritin-like protein